MAEPSTDPALPQGRSDTRAKLLRAALTAFAERGFHGTTTRDIAAAAGMSPAAVYVHYRTKQELLDEISVTGHQQTLQLIRDAIASAPTPREQLAAAIGEFARHHANTHAVARVINYELASLGDRAAAEVKELRRAIDDEIRGIVGRGTAEGSFDCAEPSMAATALLSLGVDIARWYRDEGAWTPDVLAADYAALALRIVGCPG